MSNITRTKRITLLDPGDIAKAKDRQEQLKHIVANMPLSHKSRHVKDKVKAGLTPEEWAKRHAVLAKTKPDVIDTYVDKDGNVVNVYANRLVDWRRRNNNSNEMHKTYSGNQLTKQYDKIKDK